MQQPKTIDGSDDLKAISEFVVGRRVERSLPAYLDKMDEMGIFLERWLRCDLQWSPTPRAVD